MNIRVQFYTLAAGAELREETLKREDANPSASKDDCTKLTPASCPECAEMNSDSQFSQTTQKASGTHMPNSLSKTHW